MNILTPHQKNKALQDLDNFLNPELLDYTIDTGVVYFKRNSKQVTGLNI